MPVCKRCEIETRHPGGHSDVFMCLGFLQRELQKARHFLQTATSLLQTDDPEKAIEILQTYVNKVEHGDKLSDVVLKYRIACQEFRTIPLSSTQFSEQSKLDEFSRRKRILVECERALFAIVDSIREEPKYEHVSTLVSAGN
jgi:hypothetical protein